MGGKPLWLHTGAVGQVRRRWQSKAVLGRALYRQGARARLPLRVERCSAAALRGDGFDLSIEASAPHRSAKKILAPNSEA